MKKPSVTPASLGLRSPSFAAASADLRPRVVINVEGKPKRGKTDFALTAPGPIVVFDFDRGLEGVIGRHVRKGKEIVVASYAFARPVPEKGKGGYRSDDYMLRVKKEARPIWEQFISDFSEFFESKARSAVIDTGGAAYALGRFAFIGTDKPDQKTDPYGKQGADLKSVFQGLLTEGLNHDKNVIWIHRLKELWENNQPSGKYEAAGYPDAAYEVQFSVRVDKKKQMFTAKIRDCRLDPTMDGEEFEDGYCSFPSVVAAVTGTDESDWE